MEIVRCFWEKGPYQMNFNDEKETTAQEGPNQLSHLFYRYDLNDRDNHVGRHGRAGATETEVAAQSEVT